MDHFFFEAETRMLTYHNMHANMIRQRYLKDLFTQYRGSQASYDEALVKGDAVLATALWRNLWKGDEDVDTRKMAAVVYYVRASLLGLHQLTDQQVAMAHFQFGPFEDWEDIDLKSKMMDAISESGQSVQ
jgi:cytochrome b pre-mRNA-processing protein 3